MNRTALAAAVGSALLAVYYFVTNGVPLLQNLDSVPASAVIQQFVVLFLPPLVWVWFFARVGPLAAIVTLLAAVMPQALYSWVQTWPTFSLLSLDSVLYLFSGVIQPLAYAWFLLTIFRQSVIRGAAYILWVLTTFRAMAAIVNTAMLVISLGDSLATYWTILAGPAILIFHWGSQSFFFRAIRNTERKQA
jgi:hypothetical protein